MRIPSRYMPKYVVPPMGFWGKLVLVVMLVALVVSAANASLVKILIAVGACVAIWALGKRSVDLRQSQIQALASSRANESICEFARSFNCREVDTWVVRAVYEELQEELQIGASQFPVRASDSLADDLKIDPDDIDMTLVPAIAARTGRSFDGASGNPYWGKVTTVAELVLFFNGQPMQPGRSSQRTAFGGC